MNKLFKASNQKILVLLITCLFSCENKKELSEKKQKIESECLSRKSISGFTVSFFGYFPNDANEISIKIKRNGKIIKDYKDFIPKEISDSMRHLRNYYVENEIYLSDTVFLKIKNEPQKVITDFKYQVMPHNSMLNKDWGCDFYELKVNGEIKEGGNVEFIKKNWKIIDKSAFKTYYSSK